MERQGLSFSKAMNYFKKKAFSIRVHLITLIVFMGIVGISLALGTGEVYSRLILDNYRQALQRLVELRVQELQEKLITFNQDLGLAMQQNSQFRDAFIARDKSQLMDLTDDQFFQYLTTVGLVDLQQVVLYSPDFQTILISAQDLRFKHAKLCSFLLIRARQRAGSDRLKPLSDYCLYKEQAYLGVLVPIGGLHLLGYALVISNPVSGLREAESALDMPLRIRQANGADAYVSEHWQTPHDGKRYVEAIYSIYDSHQRKMLDLSVLNNGTDLAHDLRQTQWWIIGISGTITLLVIAIWLVITQQTMIGPLRKLDHRVHEIYRRRAFDSRPIEICGVREIRQLASTFHAMNQELGQLQRQLERLAYIDQLTELPNRILFYSRLEAIEDACQGGQNNFALFMIDLNGFKKINDTLGHHIGDALLATIGKRFRSLLRQIDTIILPLAVEDKIIARLGGDEFVVIAPNAATPEAARFIAQNLHQALEEDIVIEAHSIHVGMSIGVAFYPQHTDNCDVLMQHADIAMYESKRRRQEFVIYSPELEAPVIK
jgi:diguanylate cyclase (GGDEF)-like protein